MLLANKRSILAGAFMLCSLVGCAGGARQSGSSTSPTAASGDAMLNTARASADMITRAQIAANGRQTAYDVVKSMHPNWLVQRSPGGKAVTPVVVFLDGTRYGAVERLSDIFASGIGSIQHIDGPSATMRWGTGYGGGVLYVTSIHR